MSTTEPVFSRKFESEDRTTLVDSTYEELKAAIVDSRFESGDMLRESTIAEQLGVSKTPVREAFLKLREDGLVELLPYRGAMVTGYNVDDVREVFEIRVMFESECVRWAATDSSEHLIDELAANVAKTESAVARDDVQEVIRLFDEFDAILFARLKNRRLQGLVDNLQVHLQRIGKLTTEIPGRLERSLDQHAKIVAAVASGDPDAAQRAMRDHITSVLVDGLAHMEEQLMTDATQTDQLVAGPQ